MSGMRPSLSPLVAVCSRQAGISKCCMHSSSRGGDTKGSAFGLDVLGMSTELQVNPQAEGDPETEICEPGEL